MIFFLYFILFEFSPHHSLCRSNLGDELLEGGRVGADDIAGLLLVDKGEEGGHGTDGLLLGDLGDGVDVNLGKVDACELGVVGKPVLLVYDPKQNIGEGGVYSLLKDGRDDLAGAAPCGVKVDDDNLVHLADAGELVVGADAVDSHVGLGGVEGAGRGSCGCEARCDRRTSRRKSVEECACRCRHSERKEKRKEKKNRGSGKEMGQEVEAIYKLERR